jgi:hypothetical protein
MANESCIFHFKNPNGLDSYIPDNEIKSVLDVIDPRKYKSKSITLEIDKDLYTEYKSNLDNNERVIVENIVIDILNSFNPSTLDSIFNILFTAINANHKNLNSIVVLGSSINISNLKSIHTFLNPFCKDEKIGLIAINKGNVQKIINSGKLPPGLQIPKISSLNVLPIETVSGTDTFSLEFIKSCLEENTRYLYGHFHLKFKSVDFHSNGVLSIKKCLDVHNFVPSFKNYVKSFFNNEKIKILTLCIEESGVEELANWVKNDEIEIFNPENIDLVDSFNLLILTDFLSDSYRIDSIIKNLRKKCNIKTIKVLGISKFKNYKPENKEWIIESDFIEYNTKTEECQYCLHDSIPLTGSNFNILRKSILEFDTYSFWEFIKMSSTHYSIEHYPSKRTLNHFDFRIICEDIFNKQSYTIANRLINIAEEKGIFPLWFHKVLFTNDKELAPLIQNFIEILELKYKIEINREFIDAISADNPGDKVEALFQELNNDHSKDKEWKMKNNVLIIDQAAHNFKTLSALSSVCKKYNLTLLSIALFINRADPISTGIFAKNLHLLSLYNWPVRPTKFNACFCKNSDS